MMRISSSVLLCILSVSLVTGVTILDVPRLDELSNMTDIHGHDAQHAYSETDKNVRLEQYEQQVE